MKAGPVRKTSGNKLTAIMQVHNEADRYLEQVLRELSEFVDDIVIVDDASTDGTAKLCRSFAKVKTLVTLEESRFHEEWELRQFLWNLAGLTGPGLDSIRRCGRIVRSQGKGAYAGADRSGPLRLGWLPLLRFLGRHDPLP
ncbi:glycosyltransferase [Paenibacillus sp. TAB 01]|uniref:glycosyltransferase n=1 Tax=Paenibacillus sp. TAB 01 TaxID=3368988 RepID=UPI0037527DFB